ncbi:hypothetical protein ACN1NW_000454 [Acinetobacter baumannii]
MSNCFDEGSWCNFQEDKMGDEWCMYCGSRRGADEDDEEEIEDEE